MSNALISLNLNSQEAKMGGELGAVLGQQGINIMKFCKEFNEKSKLYEKGLPLRTFVKITEKDNFDIIIKHPSTSILLKNKIDKNIIFLKEIYKIAYLKNKEIGFYSLESIFKSILSTALSMNIKIKKYD